jgi:hypothetical protein
MDAIKYILFSFLISILVIVPGIFFDSWMSKIGIIRSSRGAIIIGTIFLVFAKPFLFKELSWWIYGVGILLGIFLAVHRIDLRETYKHGAWWWKKEKKNKRKTS